MVVTTHTTNPGVFEPGALPNDLIVMCDTFSVGTWKMRHEYHAGKRSSWIPDDGREYKADSPWFMLRAHMFKLFWCLTSHSWPVPSTRRSYKPVQPAHIIPVPWMPWLHSNFYQRCLIPHWSRLSILGLQENEPITHALVIGSQRTMSIHRLHFCPYYVDCRSCASVRDTKHYSKNIDDYWIRSMKISTYTRFRNYF